MDTKKRPYSPDKAELALEAVVVPWVHTPIVFASKHKVMTF